MKLEQAARQALNSLEDAYENGFLTGITGLKTIDVLTALREALDHSGEANEMVIGWDRVKPEAIASDPLYQQGFVDGVEEGRNQIAEQTDGEQWSPDDMAYRPSGLSMEQAEREPMYISESCAERGCACHYSVEVDGEPVAVYSAPVRTKDLTDEEIFQFQKEIQYADVDPISFARAVIAADREKNNG